MQDSVDWAGEWLTSLASVGEALAWTTAGFALVAWLLMRLTRWGRQFRQLALPYFVPGKSWASWRPVLMVLLMLFLTVGAVRVNVLLSYGSSGLYTSLQGLDPSDFGRYVGILVVLAALYVAFDQAIFFVAQAFILHWRVWLTDRLLDDWLAGSAYHRNRYIESPVDNPDQRIQDDVTSFAADSQQLAIGAVKSTVSLVSFTIVLWELSGPISVLGVEVPRAMTFITFLYVIVISFVAFRLGRPLINLNFRNERLNASFRYGLMRVRENSESVAFYGGEMVEQAGLASRFAAVIKNYWTLVYRKLALQGFNSGASQLAQLVPVLIQAPRFFAGAVKLGDLQQTARAFEEVHDSLSFFRDSYDDFAAYRAVLDRLTGLVDANRTARELPTLSRTEQPDHLEVRQVAVHRPDGHTLVENVSLSLMPGQRLLVKGGSGSGKTTLLRSLAGLWPYAEGHVSGPLGENTLFLSQHPYLPLGTLRAALAYPRPPDQVDDASARAALRQVQLSHLVDHIDSDQDWARTLSPGEQQRLGFARILVNQPRVAFLDEATSSVDEGLEYALYTLICDRLPNLILISVGHRASLDSLHSHQLVLPGNGRWKLAAPVAEHILD